MLLIPIIKILLMYSSIFLYFIFFFIIILLDCFYVFFFMFFLFFNKICLWIWWNGYAWWNDFMPKYDLDTLENEIIILVVMFIYVNINII